MKRNVFLIGPMGAGKTTIGKQLAEILKLDFYDTDREIEARTGADIDWIFDLEGEEGFRVREEKMIDELSAKQGIVLATGGGAVISKQNRNYLAGRGIVVYLETSVEQQMARTRPDKRRPLLQEENTEGDSEGTLEQLSGERTDLYHEISDYTISTDGYTVKNVAKKISELLQSDST